MTFGVDLGSGLSYGPNGIEPGIPLGNGFSLGVGPRSLGATPPAGSTGYSYPPEPPRNWHAPSSDEPAKIVIRLNNAQQSASGSWSGLADALVQISAISLVTIGVAFAADLSSRNAERSAKRWGASDLACKTVGITTGIFTVVVGTSAGLVLAGKILN